MLSEDEKELFGRVAWTIYKKGHLPIEVIVRFTKDCGKNDIKKFIKLGLLVKHRTNTFELSSFGRILGFKYNKRFRK
jgi:hypothetical protein